MDDVNAFLSDFQRTWKSSQFTRVLCYAFVAALVLSMLAGAFSEVTRPRIYVINQKDEVIPQ